MIDIDLNLFSFRLSFPLLVGPMIAKVSFTAAIRLQQSSKPLLSNCYSVLQFIFPVKYLCGDLLNNSN